jgi:hypothetical protein
MRKKWQRPLSEKQAKFVAELIATGSGSKAAIAAGYKNKSPRQAAANLKQLPQVQEALAEARKEVISRGIYNLEKAMQEAEAAIEFAERTRNANAYVKAVELRSKLNGLLVEKVDVRASGFSLNIVGIASAPVPALTDQSPAPALPDIPAESRPLPQPNNSDDDDIFS